MIKKLIKRIVIGLAVFLVLGISGLAIAVVIREDRTFEAPYPEIAASRAPEVIDRGRYLVHGPAHCVACHAEPGQVPSDQPHLSGGVSFKLPVGTFYAANITPDVQTGIGRYTDRELARALRFGVHPTGRAMLPFMPFANMSDADLTAVISYLRSRPAVTHAVPEHDINVIGRFAKAFLLEPEGPTATPPAAVRVEPTVEYGKYLATTIANCNGCHTERSKRTGKAIGPEFAGGLEVESHTAPVQKFITPNLTPDPTTGRIYAWTEDQFVARFQHATPSASPMPWTQYRTMTDGDLRAVYRYLRSLPPVNTSPQ
jgi:mono/diheme cytochrome c family protein